MAKPISVLLPTTGRPVMAERCIRSLIDTTGEHRLELIVAIDADDETGDRIARMDVAWGHRVALIVDERDEYRGCSKAWNDCLAVSTGDPVVFAADDLIFEPRWLDEALARLVELPDGWGLVGFNDGHWSEDLSTHYLLSRRFIVEVLGGVVAWDFYRHSFNDLEVNERARLADRYAWCEQARVRHEHWLFGDRARDATDERTLGEHAESETIFSRRRAQGFPNDGIEAVIAC